jgi:hypothetical protein
MLLECFLSNSCLKKVPKSMLWDFRCDIWSMIDEIVTMVCQKTTLDIIRRSVFYLKQRFGDGIRSRSSDGTHSLGSNRHDSSVSETQNFGDWIVSPKRCVLSETAHGQCPELWWSAVDLRQLISVHSKFEWNSVRYAEAERIVLHGVHFPNLVSGNPELEKKPVTWGACGKKLVKLQC